MKKVLLVSALFVAMVLQTQAQDSADYKNETIEFLKLTGAGSAFVNAIDQIGALVPDDKKEAYRTEAKATLQGLYEKMADVYMEEFTHDEIKQLTVFYNSSLGKKLAEKQLALTQKAMVFGQSWGMEVHAIAQKYQ